MAKARTKKPAKQQPVAKQQPAATKPAKKQPAARKQPATKKQQRATKQQPAAKQQPAKQGRPANPLLDAIEARNAVTLARALEHGADPNSTDDEGIPLLLHAADTGMPELVAPLLDAGAPIATVDDLGQTLLMSAVAANSLELVELLLERGADPNARMTDDIEGGGTVLTIALEDPDRAAIARALVTAGADVNLARLDGWTPLMLAAYHGDENLTRTLIMCGADATASKGPERTTAADVALHKGNTGVLELLQAAGASDPAAEAADRIEDLWREIDAWFVDHARPCHDELAALHRGNTGELATLEAALGQTLPADLRAHLLRYGSGSGAPFYEYSGLGVTGIASRWRGLEELRANGTFDTFEPREIERDEQCVKFQWWDPGWIPFAEDGGGNLRCVDLSPNRLGARGQVIGWEIHGGPTRPLAASFEEFLRKYRDRLASGRLTYDADSGVFDER